MRKRFFWGERLDKGGAAFGLSWEFYIQIQTEEHVEGFYTDASRQGQQFRVPQGTTAAAGGKEESCFFTLYKPCLPLQREGSFTL